MPLSRSYRDKEGISFERLHMYFSKQQHSVLESPAGAKPREREISHPRSLQHQGDTHRYVCFKSTQRFSSKLKSEVDALAFNPTENLQTSPLCLTLMESFIPFAVNKFPVVFLKIVLGDICEQKPIEPRQRLHVAGSHPGK